MNILSSCSRVCDSQKYPNCLASKISKMALKKLENNNIIAKVAIKDFWIIILIKPITLKSIKRLFN